MSNYKHLVGKFLNTSSGKARIESVMGKYATISYFLVNGVGWLDLTTEIDFVEN